MQPLAVCAALAGSVGTVHAMPFTEWTFTGTIFPSTGSGTASAVNVLAGSPVGYWATARYPDQGTGNKTAGVQFSVSTALYADISLTWRENHGGTSPNTTVLQYTTDGNNWIDAQTFVTTQSETWISRSFDFAAIPTVNRNESFAVRIVAAFAAGGGEYVATQSGRSYAISGVIRFDDIAFFGEQIPAPGTCAALGILAARARRRRAA